MNNLIFSNPDIGEIDLINDSSVRLVEITGVGAIGQVNSQSITHRDGSTINSVIVPERSINVKFRIRAGADAESAMHYLYRIFAVKTEGTMSFYSRTGACKINYVVESCDIPPNQKELKGIAQLRCSDPYFRGMTGDSAIIAGSTSFFKFKFHFPNTSFYIQKRIPGLFHDVINNGETDTGCTIIMTAHATVENPALINVDTNETAQLNFTMRAGDVIYITTGKGEKRITLNRGGDLTNIFNHLKYPFTFFQLKQGKTTFKYDADRGAHNLDITIEWSSKYGAIYTNAPYSEEPKMTDDEIIESINDIARIVKRGGLDD